MEIEDRCELYKGEAIDIKFSGNEVDVKWLTTTHNYYRASNPFILLEYNDIMYFGIGKYEFSDWETYNDWVMPEISTEFNYFDIISERAEFDFFLFNYEETMKSDLEEFTEYELDIINTWYKKHRRDY